MDLQSQHQLFEDIEENIAFATYGHTVILCCQDSLAEAFLCVYRQLDVFYEDNSLYEFVYYQGKIIYLDINELDFGFYGDYTKRETAEYWRITLKDFLLQRNKVSIFFFFLSYFLF